MSLRLELEPEIEEKFREAAMKKYGFKKGALKEAAEDAVTTWTSQAQETLPTVKDPIAMMTGILKHLRGKKTSVQLQHEAWRLWTKHS